VEEPEGGTGGGVGPGGGGGVGGGGVGPGGEGFVTKYIANPIPPAITNPPIKYIHLIFILDFGTSFFLPDILYKL